MLFLPSLVTMLENLETMMAWIIAYRLRFFISCLLTFSKKMPQPAFRLWRQSPFQFSHSINCSKNIGWNIERIHDFPKDVLTKVKNSVQKKKGSTNTGQRILGALTRISLSRIICTLSLEKPPSYMRYFTQGTKV